MFFPLLISVVESHLCARGEIKHISLYCGMTDIVPELVESRDHGAIAPQYEVDFLFPRMVVRDVGAIGGEIHDKQTVHLRCGGEFVACAFRCAHEQFELDRRSMPAKYMEVNIVLTGYIAGEVWT